MNKIGLLICAGLLPLLILFLFMKFVSLNLSYSLLIGTISVLLASIWQKETLANPLLKVVLIAAPVSVAYYFLIVKELSGLWIALPLFVIAALVGLMIKDTRMQVMTSLGLILIVGMTSFFHIPKIVSDSLTEIVNIPAPKYEIDNLLEGEDFTHDTDLGRVKILDFFGAWCAPCIAEMEELKAIKSSLTNYENELDFILICTDTGGDTPEKALAFHAKRKLPFLLGYDENAKAHKSFDFTGVPGLVIIDKKGNVRFKHEGYNQAEDF